MRVTGSGRKLSRVDQIVEKVALMLEAGAYKTFERLPSIRQAARENGVSKNTMAEAYDRLVARGLLEARAGSGYYMSQVGPASKTRLRLMSRCGRRHVVAAGAAGTAL